MHKELKAHTPGPWRADISCDKTGAPQKCWWISAKGDVDIGETSGEKRPDEEAANALLIAAAPDLLKACKDVLPLLWGMVLEKELRPGQKGYVCDGYATWERVKAAIEKAEKGHINYQTTP